MSCTSIDFDQMVADVHAAALYPEGIPMSSGDPQDAFWSLFLLFSLFACLAWFAVGLLRAAAEEEAEWNAIVADRLGLDRSND